MRRAFFCGIVLLISFQVIYPQVPDLRFIDPLEFFDLPDHNVNCITQDTVGFIWIGTNSGLSRFDGYELKTYRYMIGDSTSLVNNVISALFIDSRSRLWIGTHHGLCLYIPEYDRFRWMIHETLNPDVANYFITDINEDKEGNIHASNTSGVYRYDEAAGTFSLTTGISKGELSSFLFDDYGNLWIGTFREGGLIKFDPETGQTRHFTHDPAKNSISSNSPVDLALRDNKLWIATYDKGVNCYDIDNDAFRSFPAINFYEQDVRSVYVDKKDLVWITDVTGLKVYDARNDVFSGYYPVACDKMSIKSGCTGIYQDNDGNYWTMHSGQGIGLSVVQKGFISFTNKHEDFWHFSSEVVSAISEDENNGLWIGNPRNGIDVFNWSEEEVKTFLYDPSDRFSLGQGAVFSIFRDSENTMWVGTNMGGLQYFDKNKKNFFSYVNVKGDTTSIANNDIRSIDEDQNGDLWVVVHGKGIDRFDRDKKTFIHYTQTNSHLSNDYCFQVLPDSRGDIWVASVWGLNVLKNGDKDFTIYFQSEKDTTTISDNFIISLHEDDNGVVWIGTANGLNRYNRQSDNFTRFSKGLANTMINAISSDSQGFIWFGTAKGITRLDPVSGSCRNFDTHDGLLTYETYPRASYRNNNKDLFFGGQGGLTIIPPEKLKYKVIPPKVIISDFDIINSNISKAAEDEILKRNLPYTESITLDYDFNDITIGYVAFDFTGPLRSQYAYKLEGYNDDWVMSGNKREVTFTNLDPKKYVFRVRAANSDGFWNNEGASIEIIIRPPWYRTWLFRILLALLTIGLVLVLIFFRTYTLQQQKIVLEKQVIERTQELREKNDLLQKQASDLNNANLELTQANSTKDKLFSIIAHDIINPFNTLLGFTDVLREDFNKISDDEKMDIIKMIGVSSDRIHELLENLLKWAKTKTGKMTVIKRVFNIRPTVQNALGIFEHSANQKKIKLCLNIPEDTHVFADEDMISTIIRNLLNNAIKFTHEGGEITVTAEQNDDYSLIMVTDNGIGIPEKMALNLFSSERKDVQTGTKGEKGSGLGLLICKEFAEINNGTISVKSEPGKGSTFTFTLPTHE